MPHLQELRNSALTSWALQGTARPFNLRRDLLNPCGLARGDSDEGVGSDSGHDT